MPASRRAHGTGAGRTGLRWDEGGGARLLVVSAQAEGLGDSAWRSWLVVQDEEVGGWMDREGIPMWRGQGGWRRNERRISRVFQIRYGMDYIYIVEGG